MLEASGETTDLVYDILIRTRKNHVDPIRAQFFVARPSLQCRDLSLTVECIEWARFRGVKSEDGHPRATRMDVKCKGNIMVKRLIVEWRRKPGYRVSVNNKRCAKSGYDEIYSKNLGIPVLTLGALVLPLRDVPGVVNVDSASESSDTSSEHHWVNTNRAEQTESDDDDDVVEDRWIKAQIRVPGIRTQDARTKDELQLCLYVPSGLSP